MEASAARKRGDQSTDHAGQKGQELGIGTVLAVLERLAKRGLVGERGERVDISEEVVNEELQHAKRRNTLLRVQGELTLWWRAEGDKHLGGVLGGGRRVCLDWRLGRDSLPFHAFCLACSLGRSVGRSSSLLLAVVGAGHVEIEAWLTWWNTALALCADKQTSAQACNKGGGGVDILRTDLDFSLAAEIARPGDASVLLAVGAGRRVVVVVGGRDRVRRGGRLARGATGGPMAHGRRGGVLQSWGDIAVVLWVVVAPSMLRGRGSRSRVDGRRGVGCGLALPGSIGILGRGQALLRIGGGC